MSLLEATVLAKSEVEFVGICTIYVAVMEVVVGLGGVWWHVAEYQYL